MRWFVLIFVLWAVPLAAVEPNEMLDDPVLENRAREISKLVRCPVCQNESIDESSAPVAQELRIVLRERLVAGDTDQEVLDYLSARFGEFVLFEPTKSGLNLILWFAAPVMALLGIMIGWRAIRGRSEPIEEVLSAQEQAELDKILGRDAP